MAPTVARDYVSNAGRKVRVGRPDGIGSLRKGNLRNTSTGGRLAVDTKPAFPQMVFGEMLDYKVDPYVEIEGVFFDVAKPAYRGKPIKIGEPEKKPAKKSKKPRAARRTPPAPGTRPSLSSIRSKG